MFARCSAPPIRLSIAPNTMAAIAWKRKTRAALSNSHWMLRRAKRTYAANLNLLIKTSPQRMPIALLFLGIGALRSQLRLHAREQLIQTLFERSEFSPVAIFRWAQRVVFVFQNGAQSGRKIHRRQSHLLIQNMGNSQC